MTSLPLTQLVRTWDLDERGRLAGVLAGDTNDQLTFVIYGNSNASTLYASKDNTGGYSKPTLVLSGSNFGPLAQGTVIRIR